MKILALLLYCYTFYSTAWTIAKNNVHVRICYDDRMNLMLRRKNTSTLCLYKVIHVKTKMHPLLLFYVDLSRHERVFV